MPQILHLTNLPPTISLHIALFTSLTNASHLHSQLVAKNARYEYAFIDPTILVSTVHALAAAYRAVHDWLDPNVGLRTPNVHSETVFSLSPSHNITDSFRRFGMSPQSTSVLVIKIIDTASTSTATYDPESALTDLTSIIEGEEVDFTDESIRKLTDMAKVRKYYKIKDYGQQQKGGGKRKSKGEKVEDGGGGGKGEEDWSELEVAVLGAMALRSYV